jgi:spermidine synthase
VVEATTTFSALPKDERIRITVADAADFLSTQPPASYDILLLDLFTDGGKTPAHLTRADFFASCRERLTPSGVLAMNLHSKADEHTERLQHLQDLFPSVYVCAVHDEVNVVFAMAQPRLNRYALIERAIGIHKRRQFHFQLVEWIMKIAI